MSSLRLLLFGEDRFELQRHLTDTLQGRIYSAIDRTTGKFVVVKETWKQLIKLKLSRNRTHVPEDFDSEKAILFYLTNLSSQANNPHSTAPSSFSNGSTGFVRILGEWEDENCFFYAMEGCEGGELFSFIKKQFTSGVMAQYCRHCESPQVLQVPLEKPNEWLLIVQDISRQLISFFGWMHQNGVAHLDASLENTLRLKSDSSDSSGSTVSRQKVKVIDFGVAHYFGNDNLVKMNKRFNANKQRVITQYNAPIKNINDALQSLRNSNNSNNSNNSSYNSNNSNNSNNNTNDMIRDKISSELLDKYNGVNKLLRQIKPVYTSFEQFCKHKKKQRNKKKQQQQRQQHAAQKRNHCIDKPDSKEMESDTLNENNMDEDDNKYMFMYNKCVGKPSYMAPEVARKLIFINEEGKRVREPRYDARAADIWSLGVMIFMMCIGVSAYQEPTQRDKQFKFLMAGQLRPLLAHWKRLPLVTEPILDLLTKIFKPEAERITMEQLKRHPFVGLIQTPNYLDVAHLHVSPAVAAAATSMQEQKLQETEESRGQDEMKQDDNGREIVMNGNNRSNASNRMNGNGNEMLCKDKIVEEGRGQNGNRNGMEIDTNEIANEMNSGNNSYNSNNMLNDERKASDISMSGR